jgi:hypothetical protein
MRPSIVFGVMGCVLGLVTLVTYGFAAPVLLAAAASFCLTYADRRKSEGA